MQSNTNKIIVDYIIWDRKYRILFRVKKKDEKEKIKKKKKKKKKIFKF